MSLTLSGSPPPLQAQVWTCYFLLTIKRWSFPSLFLILYYHKNHIFSSLVKRLVGKYNEVLLLFAALWGVNSNYCSHPVFCDLKGRYLMEKNLFEMLMLEKQKNELAELLEINQKTNHFGLSLTPEEAKELMVSRNKSLQRYQRVEFGRSVLEKLIFEFCDSQHINQDNYVEMIEELQDIFYGFKNEVKDRMTDDELLNFMKEQFETVCQGDLSYLSETCLPRLAAAIRAGYTGYQKTEAKKVYEEFSEEQRWDKDVYMEVIKELFW